MGSKGNKSTTQTAQTQAYSADPRIQQAGGQALTGAEGAAASPFSMPVAPVAGFNPFQQQAFNQVQGAQGMTDPYFQQASQYMNQSAQPLTDVSQYFNPMTSAVTAQLQNIFGQQNRMATANATQAAGGVGADRIGVAQGNLANQQTLGAGQVYSQLYGQAQAAAQADAARKQAAGYGIGQLGSAAQAANLQATSALGGAGNQQQQLAQQQLNAPYQNILAQIAYPFQTSQYLAGITGGLAPAFGGTTQGVGNSQTTLPTPSPFSQGIGVAGAALGLGGANGLFGTGKGGSASGASAANTGVTGGGYYGPDGTVQPGPGYYFADGGSVDSFMPRNGQFSPWFDVPPSQRINQGFFDIDSANATRGDDPALRAALASRAQGYADGGETEDPSSPPPFPYLSIPKTGASPIPTIHLPMGGGQFHNNLNLSPPTPAKSDSGSSGLGDIAKVASTVLPFILARGGAVNPYAMGEGFADGGDTDFNDRFSPAYEMDSLEDSGNPFDASYVYSVPGAPIEAPGTPLPHARPLGAPDVPGNVLDRAGTAVKTIETNPQGDYQNITTTRNPRTGQTQHALGAYQVMENELPEWTSKVFGEPVSKQDFLYGPNAKQIQDTLFRQRFGESAQRYGQGDPRRGVELAGREWFGGPGGVTNTGRTDAFGRLTTGGYGRQVVAGANPQEGEDITGAPADGETNISARERQFNPYAPANTDMNVGRYHLPKADQPYPDALDRDWGQRMTRSPWMALVNAGVATASTVGPIGTAIAKGIGAGAGTLENQRKELRTEQDQNLKADHLFQQAQMHLDEYTRMKPGEAGRLEVAREALRQKDWTPTQTPGGILYTNKQDPTQRMFVPWRELRQGTTSPEAPETGATPAATAPAAPTPPPKSPWDAGRSAVPGMNDDDFDRQMMVKQNPIMANQIKQQQAGMAKDVQKNAAAGLDLQRGLATMEDNYEKLVKSQTLTPGAGIQWRRNLQNVWDTVASMVSKGQFRDDNLAAVDAMQKLSTQLGFDLARTLGAREAMQIVQSAVQAVPNVSQNPQSFRRVLSEMYARAQENIDKSVAMDQWNQKHYGDLTGFNEWYANEYPRERYSTMAREASEAPRIAFDQDRSKMQKQITDSGIKKGHWVRIQDETGAWRWVRG